MNWKSSAGRPRSTASCTASSRIRRTQMAIPTCLSVPKTQAKSTASLNALELPRPIWLPQGAKSSRQTRKRTAIVRNLTVIPRKRIRMKLSLTPCLRNSPTRKRLRRKTPQKAGMRSPVSPSLPQGRARKPTGVSLIHRNGAGSLCERR